MEIRQNIVICVEKGEGKFSFSMPIGGSWGNAMDAAFEVLDQVNKLAAKAVESSKPVIVTQEVSDGQDNN